VWRGLSTVPSILPSMKMCNRCCDVPIGPTSWDKLRVSPPRFLVLLPVRLDPVPGKEMRRHLERRTIRVGLVRDNCWVELCLRVERHIIVLCHHAGEQPRPDLITDVAVL
jgi:hypothetical protein